MTYNIQVGTTFFNALKTNTNSVLFHDKFTEFN